MAGFGEILRYAWLSKGQGQDRGHPFRASFTEMGKGKHMLPVKAEIRKTIGKEVGDVETVTLETSTAG